jgi:serine protease
MSRIIARATVALVLLGALATGVSPAAAAGRYAPGVVVVGYLPGAGPAAPAASLARTRMQVSTGVAAPELRVVRVPAGANVQSAAAGLRRAPGVAFAVPDYLAHAAGVWYPDDPGRSRLARGWEALQWNFLSAAGIEAPPAWANLIADGRPGGRGVTVAILDSGIAYRDWRGFRESPDFIGTRFVAPHDFIAGNRFPLDREGHGTFVAGTVAEATNNANGLTGIAYGASIMPVRVLDANGDGPSSVIAQGIYYAARHGARIINLSLQFDLQYGPSDIPDVLDAIRFAQRRGVLIVAAAGNDATEEIAYPAAAPGVVAVGASTRDLCLADYSNYGPGLALVAPGGGDDASLPGARRCHPGRDLPDVYQMTLRSPVASFSSFGLQGGWYGTSMAAAHVTGVAALVIASGGLGPHPSAAQLRARLERTARRLGGRVPNPDYGHGLLNAAAATASPAHAGRRYAGPAQPPRPSRIWPQ